jgi:hypothetical protein
MGRPLKIQKYGANQGTGSPGAAVGVDLGFPNFGSLTNPVYNSADTLNSAEFLGVVGGATPTDNPSATYPRVAVIVNIANPSGSGLGVHAGYIIRQKGAHKYLVGDADATIAPSSFVVGQAYQVVSVGTTTNWQNVGAGSTVSVGDVFTATAVGSGNGTAYPVGVCVLADDTTPSAGFMAITYTLGDSTATTISKLTNKWLLNFAGGSDYEYTSVVNDERYVANFFTDEGTVIKSGTAQTTVELAIVDNVTS